MQTITVSSLSELYSALASAKGGETIELASGNYGAMSLSSKSKFDITFASNVTITSADPNSPAVFTGLDIDDAANLTFDGVVFDYTFKEGHPISAKPFSVSGGENITIRNCTFDGDVASGVSDVDDGYGYGYGLGVGGTSNFVLDGNEFYNFHRALVVGGSENITVTNNDIHSIRSDGMDFTSVQGALIEGNYIHDFNRSSGSSDHGDMIQFWTNGTTIPSTDIMIRGNILDIGDGGSTQSIFMRNDMVDRGLAGPEMFYQNVTIEDNIITNGHSHGITVGETAGLTIRNNTVVHSDGGNQDEADSAVEIPKINVASTSTDVIITQNITSAINGYGEQSTWTVSDNALVQDQDKSAPNHYSDIFIASSLQGVDGVHNFTLLPGSVADQLGAGAQNTAAPSADDALAARFHITSLAGDGATRVFDAGFSDLGGLPAGTKVTWDFGDGTIAEGVKVSHTYAKGGTMDVVMKITTPDGKTTSAALDLDMAGSNVVTLTAAGGFDIYEKGQAVSLGQAAVGSTEGLQLGATGSSALVSYEYLSELPISDEIDIDFSLKADKQGASGELFRIHGSFIASVNAAGALVFSISSPADGTKTLTSNITNLSNGAEHDIAIRIADGAVLITVDGVECGGMLFSSPISWSGSKSLTFGNPWGKENFNGDLTAFNISTNASDYPAAPETVVLQPSPDLDLSDSSSQPTSDPVVPNYSGDNIHIIDSLDDVVVEAAGGGYDTIETSISLVLVANVEKGVLTGAARDLTGNELDNLLIGNDLNNRLDGGLGADTLYGGAGNDTLVGGTGGDLLYGGLGADKLNGGSDGGDTLYGDAGNDTLVGGVGNDILDGGADADKLHGGDGNDLLNGGAGNDFMSGGLGADTLYGGDGDDTLSGGTGGDLLYGGLGADKLNGGSEGGDTLYGDTGNDTLVGGVGNDILDGGADADQLWAGEGNDLIYGGDGSDRLGGSTGSDTLYGGADADTMWGGDGADVLYGDAGHDLLNGGLGADTLYGGLGHDTLLGGDGNDLLNGGTGDDIMTGGLGADVFVFNAGFGKDTIADFSTTRSSPISTSGVSQHDVLRFDGFAEIHDFAGFKAAAKQVGDSVVYDFGSDGVNVLTLEHVRLDDLLASDFMFT